MSISIPRSLALAGAAALAASMALTGAQGAFAAATGSPSAAAAPQADKAAHRQLDLSLDGVPGTFVAGGESKQFSFTVDNDTKTDFVFYPLLKFKNAKGSLHAEHLKVEYQLPKGLDKTEEWQPGVVAPGGATEDNSVLFLLGKVIDGVTPDFENSLLAVKKGKSVTLTVRVSLTKDAPLGVAALASVVFAAKAEGTEPVEPGDFSCEDVTSFTIVPGGGKPSPTATPSTTKPTTPSATPTVKPTGSPSTTGSPSATATPTATGSPSATTTPSTTPTATGSPSATTTPSTTPTATGSPSATATPTTTATASPSATATATPSATVTASPSATAPDASVSQSQSPAAGGSGDRPTVDFPVNVPAIAPLPITPAAVAKAKANAENADKALATTGGGDDTTAIAIAGGAVLAAGVGTLVVLRRRRTAQQG
ncbi:LPXTG cell wall anchor domain-containing protein [Kitasatospora purpeofusca]|uniref:LPXTG cell wall anchor domain-containing protein n=1 Tax=Kitasatospora purpeofusca TaxID=67352 RepID=UPI003F4AA412